MCGICGFTGNKRQEKDKILEDMMGTLVHRGPDEGKKWLADKMALGFRRLSIIDLEGSSQPMGNETGELMLVFNGEIYNYRELRSQLQAAGHRFRTQGDSEVLLHGYEEWGAELTGHLRGMFAFAIWDEGKEELFAARDFFGIKPFFYAMVEGELVFASEIKAILAYPGYQKRLNEEALEQYLSFQYSVLEETFFQGIYRLPPGCRMSFSLGEEKPRLERYFRPTLLPGEKKDTGNMRCLRRKSGRAAKPEQEGSLDNAPELEQEGSLYNTTGTKADADRRRADRLEAAIKDSVESHMAADVEVGTFLSGGVDSSLIAALFTGYKAFTVGFGDEGSGYNEIPLARKLAQEKNLEYQEKIISPAEFWEAVPEALYYLDEPSADPAAIALYFVAREAAQRVKVVVSGEGADELFGGYCIYCEPNALRFYQKLPLGFRRMAAALAEQCPEHKGRSFLIRGSKSVEERFIGNANLFTCKEREALLKNPQRVPSPQELLAADYAETAALDDASRMQYIDLLHWLPGDILQKADRMSMAHSLELRVPYLDLPVFEEARRLPASCKQKGQQSKTLFRRVAARHLTGEESSRRKLGFPVPLEALFASPQGEEELRRVFSSPAAARYFRQEELDKLLQKRKSRGGNRKIWAVYAFLKWYEIYFP